MKGEREGNRKREQKTETGGPIHSPELCQKVLDQGMTTMIPVVTYSKFKDRILFLGDLMLNHHPYDFRMLPNF